MTKVFKNDRALPDWALDWVHLRPADIPIRSLMESQVRILVPPIIGLIANAARAQLEYKMDDSDEARHLRIRALLPPIENATSPATSNGEHAAAVNVGPRGKSAREPASQPGKSRAKGKPKHPDGVQVRILSDGALLKYQVDVEFLGSRKSREDARVAKSVAEELLKRGACRTVALDKKWERRLGELSEQMPSFAPVIQHIGICCSLATVTRRPLRITPLLLVGPPGIGKTHFAVSVAEALGLPRYLYAMESAETIATLSGSDKHWSNSEPGQLFRHVVLGEIANPLFVLDEVDKARSVSSDGSGYRPATALLGPLEPLTARTLRDKSADVVFDASHVVYIATANLLSPIDHALLSRFKIFHINEPDARSAVSTARSIASAVLRDLGLDKRFPRIKGEVLQELALRRNPRAVRQLLETAIGRAIADGRWELEPIDLEMSPDLRSSEPHRLM